MTLVHTGFIPLPPGQQSGFDHADVYSDTIVANRLWCAADGTALVILHRDTGAVLNTIPLPGEPDVVMHDATLARLYVAIGTPGVLCVVDTTRRELVETIPTERGAHTIGWNAAGRTLYVFQPESADASVFVEAL